MHLSFNGLGVNAQRAGKEIRTEWTIKGSPRSGLEHEVQR